MSEETPTLKEVAALFGFAAAAFYQMAKRYHANSGTPGIGLEERAYWDELTRTWELLGQ